MTDKRLTAALKWWKESPNTTRIEDFLAGMIAAIDAEDPLRKPVTEEEVLACIDEFYRTNGGARASMRYALAAFLAARGVAETQPPLCETAVAAPDIRALAEQVDRLERTKKIHEERLDRHLSDLANLEERLDALEAQPSWTAEKKDKPLIADDAYPKDIRNPDEWALFVARYLDNRATNSVHNGIGLVALHIVDAIGSAADDAATTPETEKRTSHDR